MLNFNSIKQVFDGNKLVLDINDEQEFLALSTPEGFIKISHNAGVATVQAIEVNHNEENDTFQEKILAKQDGIETKQALKNVLKKLKFHI